jgi:N-acetylneuraminate synthase
MYLVEIHGVVDKLSYRLFTDRLGLFIMNKNSDIFVIAEAGINHNGDVDTALELIDLAARTGCDAVKFQKRDPDICVPDSMKPTLRETPWGTMTYLDYKKRIEFGANEYKLIAEHSRSRGIAWSASAWDIGSLEFLDDFDLPFNKIASALSTHIEFVQAVAKRGKLTYASVGMCSYEDIDKLVSIFQENHCQLVLMHTVSTYPASEVDLNLRMINTLGQRYGVPVGYSGHEPSVSPSIVAGVLGAVAIERHITLDRSMWGTDHSASLEEAGLTQLVTTLRKIPIVVGDGIKRNIPAEDAIASKMRYWI